jgi:hypothetical protein
LLDSTPTKVKQLDTLYKQVLTTGSPVSQSIQSRLDSYAVVTDFGAVGDGQTDDTAAINRALFQLYCVQANTQVRRSLFFPAGNYIVTDSILIPPYARLYGEGSNSSIIDFQVQNWAANTAYAQGVLVYYVPGSAYYRSVVSIPATGIPVSDPHTGQLNHCQAMWHRLQTAYNKLE